MTETQRTDLTLAFGNAAKTGILDYVAAWYVRAAQYIQNTNIKVAFVSTNSITQGEQVGILWKELIEIYKIKIHFAHKTFKWSNEARGNAAVYCIIVGFGNYDIPAKYLYEYTDVKGEPSQIKAQNINPYLADAKDIFIGHQKKPLCDVPEINFGNMPLDGGHLLLSDDEKNELLRAEPAASAFIKPLISAREFLNNEKRWCLWLVDAQPHQLRAMPLVMQRIEKVKQFRLDSIAPSTQKFADTPKLFRDRNTPSSFIIIPSTSSENRKYIPMGFFGEGNIPHNSCHLVPNGDLFLFGVLTSEMHMTWVRYVCGRLKSDFRYSKEIVYNNYPFPSRDVSDANRQKVIAAAQRVLDVRAAYPASSLADLYDALAMPPDLVKAHQALDKAVDVCYRPQPFTNELNRIEFLFQQYEQLTYTLFATPKKKRK